MTVSTVHPTHPPQTRAGYFDGQAHPDLSLLALGARLGCTVLAVDRTAPPTSWTSSASR